ncbi:MAG: hypothetical protein EA397_02220 [Deltaproteobacteria bacterium]|nr:MAG: hypothetical protein EA397_02220 [Deltaproteobacteria bacterium]
MASRLSVLFPGVLAVFFLSCGGPSADTETTTHTGTRASSTTGASEGDSGSDSDSDSVSTMPGLPGTYLALSDFSNRTVELFGTPDDLSAMVHRSTLEFTFAARPCGVGVGPDERVYIADASFPVVGVYTLAGLIEGGEQPFIGDVGSSAINSSCGVAFDAEGTLWVGDGTHGRVLGLRDATSIVGEVDLEADVVIRVSGPGVTPWADIDALHIDPSGDLWVVDYEADTITRIAQVASLNDGNHTALVPAAQLSSADATDGPDLSSRTFHRAGDVAVDGEGRLYVGSRDASYISRFDGARTLEGVVSPQPDAYLVTELERAYLVALDPEGALWTGNGTRVARLSGDPSAPMGVQEASLDRVIPYADAEGTPYSGHGGMSFFVAPPRE